MVAGDLFKPRELERTVKVRMAAWSVAAAARKEDHKVYSPKITKVRKK